MLEQQVSLFQGKLEVEVAVHQDIEELFFLHQGRIGYFLIKHGSFRFFVALFFLEA
jgi:hypothetical protein